MSPTPFESSSTRPVLGQWKNFEFRMILDPSQYPEVLQHLHKNFFHSTPLTRGLECSQKYFEEFDKIYLTTLPQNLSFAAIDLDTKEIAGLRITFVQDRKLEETFKNLGFETRQMEIMNKIMGTVNDNANIYGTYGIDSFINFYTACVDPKYMGQGLATEMYDQALKFILSKEKFRHQYVKSNLTSPYTRKICNKFGFTELARVYYNDFKDENGKPLLNGCKDDEFVAFMCLKLE